jgi:hypothetical protein
MMAVMSTHRTFRRTCQGIALAAIFGLLSACGGSDDASSTEDAVSETASSEPTVEGSEIGDAADSSENDVAPESEPEAAPPAAPTGGGSATLVLDNGESFEFSVLCSLEPQIAAGSEILFTATSFDDPSLDITQFGDEGPVVDLASISVYDASFDTLWEANSFFEALGGGAELTLDGSTITGTGSFFPAGDIEGTAVNGTVVANC